MDKIWHNLKLDLADGGSQGEISVRANDAATQVLSIQLRTGGKVYQLAEDVVATLHGTRRDGTMLYNACYIEDNCIRMELKSELLGVAGRVECVIKLVGTEPAALTTPGFDIYVEAVPDDAKIEAADSFGALVEATAQMAALRDQVMQDLREGNYQSKILGKYDTPSQLQAAVKNPKVGDLYSVGVAAPYDLYVFDGTQWQNIGTFEIGGVVDQELDPSSTNAVSNAAVHMLTPEIIGAAPGGYGLGRAWGSEITNGNSANINGFYSWISGSENVPFDKGFMIVASRGTSYMQIAFEENPTITTPNVAIRKSVGGAYFSQWEWVNPPMYLAVEYRTTERWNGKPVYVKRFEMEALPASGSGYIAVGIFPTSIVSVEGLALDTTTSAMYGFPICNISGDVVARVGRVNSGRNLWIHVYADMSAYKGYFTIKYVKD